MRKRYLYLFFVAAILSGCMCANSPIKDVGVTETEAGTESNKEDEKEDPKICLMEQERLNGAEEYCFKIPQGEIEQFSDTIFTQNKDGLQQYFQFQHGEIVGLTAKEETQKNMVTFTNPYTNRQEEISLELEGVKINENFYMTKNGKSGQYIENDGMQEWVDIVVRPAYKENLIWLEVCDKEPGIAETGYAILYDMRERKTMDIIRTIMPEEIRPSKVLISPGGRNIIIKEGQAGEKGLFYYLDVAENKKIFINDLISEELDSVVFEDDRTLALVTQKKDDKTEKYYYDLLDNKVYGELESFTPQTIQVENSTAFVSLENNTYVLCILEKRVSLMDLDSNKTYVFLANPSENKFAVIEKNTTGIAIKEIGIYDLESQTYTVYPQNFSYGQAKEFSWVGDACFGMNVWGGYYYFYEF